MVVMAGCGRLAGTGLAVPETVAEGGIVAHRGALRRNLRRPALTAVPRPVPVPAQAVAASAGSVRSSNGQRILTRQRATASPADRADLIGAACSVFGVPPLPASGQFANGTRICGLGAARCGVTALAVLKYHERCCPATAV